MQHQIFTSFWCTYEKFFHVLWLHWWSMKTLQCRVLCLWPFWDERDHWKDSFWITFIWIWKKRLDEYGIITITSILSLWFYAISRNCKNNICNNGSKILRYKYKNIVRCDIWYKSSRYYRKYAVIKTSLLKIIANYFLVLRVLRPSAKSSVTW